MPRDQEFDVDGKSGGGAVIESIGHTVVDEVPEPQQHAIDQMAQTAEPDAQPEVEVDELGVPWNPAEHATGRDGKGIKTAKGTWRKRRGMGGSESVLRSPRAPKPETESASAQPAGPTPREIACRTGGAMAARLLVQLSVGIGGQDFVPGTLVGPEGSGVKIEEQSMLETAFGDYFVAKDIGDLPPGWALAGALSMYYLPRLQMREKPDAPTRLERISLWFKSKVIAWRMRKAKKAGKQPERTNAERSE